MSVIYRVWSAANGQQRFGGSQADVRAAKAELMDLTRCKRKDLQEEELVIEYSKSGVLDFLGRYAGTVKAETGN